MSFIPKECGNSNWIPDEDAPECRKCGNAFTACNRRHHCRYCGDVFCDPCSFIMDKGYPSAYRTIRICQYCHSLYFTRKDMVQEGATFDKATKDGKGQRSRFFQLVDVEGTQTIRWTGTNTIARRLSRPLDGEDRSIKLTEVKRVLHFKEPGTKRGSTNLVIKLESTTRDLILLTTNKELCTSWLEALQAAHHVSHSTKRIEQWKKKKAKGDAAQMQAKRLSETQALMQRQWKAAEKKTSH